MHYFELILAGSLVAQAALAAENTWQPLFNGRDFTGWDTEMMNLPDPAWDVPGLQRGTNGLYLEALGKNRDPLHVFTVTNVDGGPVIHVSGQGFGVMMTTATFTNVHVRLEIKWGDRRWGKKSNSPWDTGLLYFCHSEAGLADRTWPRSLEFQICQNELGISMRWRVKSPRRRGGMEDCGGMIPPAQTCCFFSKGPSATTARTAWTPRNPRANGTWWTCSH